MASPPSSPPAQKLSRYRSQRKPGQEDAGISQQSPATAEVDDSIARSKSRYRRRNYSNDDLPMTGPATARDQEQIDVVQRPQMNREQQLPLQSQPLQQQGSISRRNSASRYRDRYASPPAGQLQAPDPERRRIRSNEMDWEDEDERRRKLRERYSVKQQEEMPVSGHGRPTVSGELFPPPRPEVVQTPANPQAFDGPPDSSQIRATKSMTALHQYLNGADSDSEDGGAGCFGLFKRKRGEAAPRTALEKREISRPKTSGDDHIKPGGGGIVPGIDAPISASNAGDRRVLVECGKSKTIFLVTQTTTPIDIINKAALCMPNEKIDVNSAVLLEFFGTVGVQRPLRRYEHIRDVMNSWDSDGVNSLLLVDPRTGTSEAELSIAGAPNSRPADDSWLMSFSQKVGKWDKRLITLQSSGQITMQKDPRKPEDQTNICHLSDFDIYTPTQEKVKKKVKPPKKYCFAIKSQQKTAMFESTQNFVHFFCTGDQRTADAFYAAIQGWRSWYLVNVMGEGPKKTKARRGSFGEKEIEIGGGAGNAYHKKGGSGYQLGSFKPLDLNADAFERPAVRPVSKQAEKATRSPSDPQAFVKSANQLDPGISPERRTSTVKRKQHPPGSMGNRGQLAEDEPLINLSTSSGHARRASIDRKRRPSLEQKRASSEDEFATTGLLGRRYSQKQKEFSERERMRRPDMGQRSPSEEEFFTQQGLLGRRYSQRARDATAGANEQREKEKPFTTGANMLSGTHHDDERSPHDSWNDRPVRRHSTRRPPATSGGELGRSNSQRAKETTNPFGRPLVDLTPQYREPPQHLKKTGKGFNPNETPTSGPLIDNATSPDDPVGVPSSTDWRSGRNAASHARSNSLSRQPTSSRQRPHTSREVVPASQAFTGEGLLAGERQGWGTGSKGRGVMDGSRAQGPMVDLTEREMFANGSLLNKVERVEGPGRPVIDRGTRKEEYD